LFYTRFEKLGNNIVLFVDRLKKQQKNNKQTNKCLSFTNVETGNVKMVHNVLVETFIFFSWTFI